MLDITLRDIWLRLRTSVSQEGILLVAFSLAAGLFLTFGMIAEEVLEGDTHAFDSHVLSLFGHGEGGTGPGSPLWLEFVRDITSLGSFAVLGFFTVATLGYLLLIGRRPHAMLATIAIIGGAALSTLLKALIDRPRPDIAYAAEVFTASFPSGHAMLSTVTYLTISSLLMPVMPDHRTRLFLVVQAIFLSLAVGVSRIYLGVHYPSDVLAGWCAGGAWASLCFVGASLFERKWLLRGKIA